MNILITGAKGQLGTELLSCLDKGVSRLGDIPACYEWAKVTGVDLPDLDIGKQEDTIRFIRQGGYDLVINCAAFTNVDGCETQRDTAFVVNALGARNMAIAAETAGAKLIHVSTDYVFSGVGDTPWSEWDIPAPGSVYGKSKYLGEQYVRDFSTRYFIVRTAWLYGLMGHNFVKTIIRVAREKGKVKVVNDQVGNPTNAADLAHHLLLLGATNQYGLYHCTNEGQCSWYDFADKFLKLAGVACEITPCTTEEYPSPTARPAYSAMENRMLRLTVGNAMRPWEDAIEDYIQLLCKGE